MDPFLIKVAALAAAAGILLPAQVEQRLPSAPKATVMFAGDVMLDRSIRTIMGREGEAHVFSCLKDELAIADAVVANLEGPVTANGSVSVGTKPSSYNNMTFTFATTTPRLLRDHNIWLVNLGNNHIFNFGPAGYAATKRYLSEAGVSYFGDVSGEGIVHHADINGIRLAFISYNEFGGSAPRAIVNIKAAKAAGEIPLVYTHWGNEYETRASAGQRKLARAFVDAGAEMVIGSHPHVVQDSEVYEGKHIYYSLGNFIFDQYWEQSVRRGLMLEVRLDGMGVFTVRELPVELQRDGRTCPL